MSTRGSLSDVGQRGGPRSAALHHGHRPVRVPPVHLRAARRPSRPAGLRRHAGRVDHGALLLHGRRLPRLPVRARRRHPPRPATRRGSCISWLPGSSSSRRSSRRPTSERCGFRTFPEAINVLLVLALIVGAPAFLLATTSPLLSAWFAGRGGDPWWLYAASNAASLVGLLAYPFIIEPNIPLSGQRVLLTLTLVLFAITLVAVVVGGRRTRPAVDRPSVASAPPLGAPPAGPVADRGDHPGRPPVGDDDVSRHRPRVRTAPVGRTAGHLPREFRHRLLRSRPSDPADRRAARAGGRDPDVDPLRAARQLADRRAGDVPAGLVRGHRRGRPRPAGARPSGRSAPDRAST